jgi:CTP synthase (UTP-ammonia lyase)
MRRAFAILGEFKADFEPHAATNEAITHSRARLGAALGGAWVSTADVDGGLFERFGGIWIAPGSPYRDFEKTLWAIGEARQRRVPCFGTCGGFQHMVLEYARNVLGIEDAAHAEEDPEAPEPFIAPLECSLAGREMRLRLAPGSQIASIYGGLEAIERYYCRFGVNPAKAALLASGPLRVSASDAEGEARAIELPGHPFFIGVLYVPQARSSAAAPHPLVTAFLEAVCRG